MSHAIKISSCIIIIVVAFLLLSCGKDEKTDSWGEITFATHRDDVMDTVIRRMADEFEKDHPGAKINIISPTDDEMLMKLAVADWPDILSLSNFVDLIDDYTLHFYPLKELGFLKENFRFFKGGLGKDDKLYLISNCINYDGIVYNKKVFKEVGIKNPPETKDEFFDLCRLIKSKSIIPIAINFSEKWTLRYFGANHYTAAVIGSPNYLVSVVDGNKLLTPNGVLLEGLDFLRKIVDNGYAEKNILKTSWNQSKIDMAEGKIAMMYLGTWFPPQLVDNGLGFSDIGMFPLPESKALVSSVDVLYGINKDSKNIKLAQEFFKFLFLKGKFAEELGILPPNKGYSFDQPFMNDLFSSNLPTVEGKENPQEVKDRLKQSEIDLLQVTQEYIMADVPQDVIKKYNKLWEESLNK